MFTLVSRQNAPTIMAPPGITPNYINPVTQGDRILVYAPLLGALSLLFVGLRLVIKLRILKTWALDDTFILIAVAFALARVGMNVHIVADYMVGRHTWDLPPTEFLHVGNGSKNGLFIGDMLYFMGIMFTKLSILTLYRNVFKIHKRFRIFVYFMMGVVVSYCLIFFFITCFSCNPVERVWKFIGWTGGGSCVDMINVTYAAGGVNIFTDLVILVMPLPLLAQLQLDKMRKFGLMAVFATGIFVVVASIVRQIIVVQTYRDFDQNWNVVNQIIWLTAELCVGIICACLPCLATLYTRRVIQSFVPQSWKSYLSQSKNSRYSKKSSSTSRLRDVRSAVQLSSMDNVELIDTRAEPKGVSPHGHTSQIA